MGLVDALHSDAASYPTRTEEIVKSNQMNFDALQNLPPAANNRVLLET